MNSRRLKHFVVLAETLNFSRAAESLHMTQPPLSTSIRHLENEVGAPLFERGTRRVMLTELGRSLLPAARKAVAAMELVSEIARNGHTGQFGTLKLSFPSGAAHRLLPRVLPAFKARYPNVELKLREASTSQTVGLMERGEVDVGIVYYPLTSQVPFTRIPSEDDRLVAVLPIGHLLLNRKRLQLKDLSSLPMLGFEAESTPTLHMVTLMACQRAGFTPRIVQEMRRIDTMVSLVRSGAGVALLPSVCKLTYGHSVHFKEISDCRSALTIGLGVVRRPDAAPVIVENFVNLLLEVPGS